MALRHLVVVVVVVVVVGHGRTMRQAGLEAGDVQPAMRLRQPNVPTGEEQGMRWKQPTESQGTRLNPVSTRTSL